MATRNRHSRSERMALAAECISSGEAVGEVAARNGVRPSTVENWLSEYRKSQDREMSRDGRFVAVDLPSASTSTMSLQVAGVMLDFAQLPPPAYLAAVAKALG